MTRYQLSVMIEESKQPKGFMLRYTTITYSGLPLDTFMDDNEQCYVTLTSLASGLDISRQSVKNWVQNHNTTPGIPVKVGIRKSTATAYPTGVITEFLKYRSDQGDKKARALLMASFIADLKRTILEANGILVTAAQHEEVRHSTRLAILQQWVKDNYQPTMLKNGVVVPIDYKLVRDAGFENSTENQIVELEALIARREVYIASGKWGAEQCAEEQRGIESYRKDIQTLAQSLSN